ncbi:AAA family ATPase, partial [Sutterella seckii]
MTGITKYRQTSIFSEFNFFDDISLNRAYGTLIGYTEEEIKNYFSYYLNEAKLQLELDEDEIVDQLRGASINSESQFFHFADSTQNNAESLSTDPMLRL